MEFPTSIPLWEAAILSHKDEDGIGEWIEDQLGCLIIDVLELRRGVQIASAHRDDDFESVRRLERRMNAWYDQVVAALSISDIFASPDAVPQSVTGVPQSADSMLNIWRAARILLSNTALRLYQLASENTERHSALRSRILKQQRGLSAEIITNGYRELSAMRQGQWCNSTLLTASSLVWTLLQADTVRPSGIKGEDLLVSNFALSQSGTLVDSVSSTDLAHMLMELAGVSGVQWARFAAEGVGL
jgi:hypothetical protein